MSNETEWKTILENGENTRKRIEDFVKKENFKLMDTYVALKLWVYVLEKTQIPNGKDLDKVIELMVGDIEIKEVSE